MWIVLVFLRKNTTIHRNGRNSWTFRFGPFFGLVCRGDSWFMGNVELWERGEEVSLGNVALWDAGKGGQESQNQRCPKEILHFWRRGLETEILSWEMWHFERLWGGLYAPMVYVNSIIPFSEISWGEISTRKFLRINFWNMSSHIQLKIVLELILT